MASDHVAGVRRPRPIEEGAGAAVPRPVAPAIRRRAVHRDDFRLEPVTDVVKSTVQQITLDLIFSGQYYNTKRYLGARPELPGPMAVTLSRRTLRVVESSDYWVCEKSDGERAMLLMTARPMGPLAPGAYLVNRAFNVHTFPRAHEYAHLCAKDGVTLIDGELILRDDDEGTGAGKAVYMMFDAVWANGVNVGCGRFDARMSAIAEKVRLPFRTADNAAVEGGAPGFPLFLSGKFFAPKSRLRMIFDSITQSGDAAAASHAPYVVAPLESAVASSAEATHGIKRKYRNDYRVNGTDGIIFTPQASTYADMFASGSSQMPLLKWKFADVNTIDYVIMQTDLEGAESKPQIRGLRGDLLQLIPLNVYAGPGVGVYGGDIDLAVAKLALSLPAAHGYLQLMAAKRVSSLVVECAYDTTLSAWVVERVRDSKTKANALNTAWQTLEVMAENITQDELVSRLSGGGGGVARATATPTAVSSSASGVSSGPGVLSGSGSSAGGGASVVPHH